MGLLGDNFKDESLKKAMEQVEEAMKDAQRELNHAEKRHGEVPENTRNEIYYDVARALEEIGDNLHQGRL